MDSLSLRLCPPAAHPATTSSRSVLSTCFFFPLLLVLAILECTIFFFWVFGFCFVFVFVIFWWDGLLWFLSSSSPLFFWHSNASLVIRDHVCFVCVFFWFVCSGFFFVDFSSVGSALAKW